MKKIKIVFGSSNIGLSLKSLTVIIAILFFLFQRQFIDINSVFEYFDEIFIIYVFLKLIINIFQTEKINKNNLKVYILILILIIIGLIGNVRTKILTDFFNIGVDIISIFKVILSYYWVKTLSISEKEKREIIVTLSKILRFIVLIMFICFIGSYLGIINNMLDTPRYGLRPFKFIFNNAGNYSKWFYLVLPLLTVDLYYGFHKKKILFIAITIFLWLMTLRSRAISFILCYLIFAFYYFYIRNHNKVKINIMNVLPFCLIAIIMFWEQIVFYLTNETQARANMLKYAFVNAKNYFPLGSGFGTYGSDVAAKTYSSLYYKYGFNKIYGMGNVHTNYLNDNYWPMIIGQFGIIGTIIMIGIIYNIYKEILNNTKDNRYFYFSMLCLMFFLLASSIASKSYCEYTMISIFIFQGIFVKDRNTKYLNINSL